MLCAGLDAMPVEPPSSSTLHIAVIGGSATDSNPSWYTLAEEVGSQVAKSGCVLVNGGGTGTMVASAKGAVDAGGATLGILPGSERDDANEFIQHAVPTGLGHLRNTVVVHAADSVIALPGSWGTLSEIALARVWGKPVVALSFWAHFFDARGADLGFDGIHLADDAASAVRKAVHLAQYARSRAS